MKYIVIVLAVLTSTALGQEQDVSLYGVHGVVIDVVTSDDMPVKYGTAEIFQSMMRLQLTRNGISVYSSWEEAGLCVNIPQLTYTVNIIEGTFKDGSLSGLVVFSLSLDAEEYVDLRRFKALSCDRYIPDSLPAVWCSIWQRGSYGNDFRDDLKATVKESLTEFLDIFISDLQKANSPSTPARIERQLKETQAHWDSVLLSLREQSDKMTPKEAMESVFEFLGIDPPKPKRDPFKALGIDPPETVDP